MGYQRRVHGESQSRNSDSAKTPLVK